MLHTLPYDIDAQIACMGGWTEAKGRQCGIRHTKLHLGGRGVGGGSAGGSGLGGGVSSPGAHMLAARL